MSDLHIRLAAFLDSFSIFNLFLLTLGIVLASLVVGYVIGRLRQGKVDDSSMNTIVTAVLGLLAFLLAFTFGITASRFETRKQLLLDEVNAIETVYLRSALIPQPQSGEMRHLVREYVSLRSDWKLLTPENLPPLIARFNALQGNMWEHAVSLAEADTTSVYLFTDALNRMFDLHTNRLTVAHDRIHSVVWYVLYFLTVLSMMVVGFQFGAGGKGSILLSLILAFTFSSVLYLVFNLDRPAEGIRVNLQPMVELQERIQAGAK